MGICICYGIMGIWVLWVYVYLRIKVFAIDDRPALPEGRHCPALPYPRMDEQSVGIHGRKYCRMHGRISEGYTYGQRTKSYRQWTVRQRQSQDVTD